MTDFLFSGNIFSENLKISQSRRVRLAFPYENSYVWRQEGHKRQETRATFKLLKGCFGNPYGVWKKQATKCSWERLGLYLSGSTVDFICCMVEKGFNSSCWKIWSNLFCLSKDMVMPWRFLLLVTSAQCRMTWWSWHQLPDYDLLSTFILHLQTIQLVAFPTKMNAVIQCRHYIGYGHP